MEARLKSNSCFCYQKVFAKTVYKEESQDCVVPDSLPDIASIVNTCGNVFIRSKDVSDGRIRIEANVPCRVLFLAEEGGGYCCLDVNIPIYVSAEDENIREGCKCSVGLTLTKLETRMLNPRKVSIQVEVSITLDCYAGSEITIVCDTEESAAPIHCRSAAMPISPVCCVTEKTFVLTDEVILQQGTAAAAEIVAQNTLLQVEDLKTVGSKIILKGSAVSRLMYRTTEMSLATVDFATAYSQIIDVDELPEDPYLSVSLLLSGAYYDVSAGFDGRTIKMELHVVAQAEGRTATQLTYLADAYSNSFALELRKEKREASSVRTSVVLRDAYRQQLTAFGAVSEVAGVCITPIFCSAEADTIQLRLRVKLCCKDAEGAAFVYQCEVTQQVKGDLYQGKSLEVSSIIFSDVYAAPAGGGIELRFQTEVSAFILASKCVECICAIEYDETAPLDLSGQPTLVLLKSSSGDDLWALARENHSTVEAIVQVNGLDAMEGTWEKLLLIPRTE